MKKILFLVILSCMIIGSSLLAQNKNKDSIEWAEMRRLNRMGDSIHQALVIKESVWQADMSDMVLKTKREMAERRAKELEEATKEVVARQEKTQRSKTKTLLLAGAAFAVVLVGAGIMRKRRKQTPRSRNDCHNKRISVNTRS